MLFMMVKFVLVTRPQSRMNNAGFEIAVTRGDNVKWSQDNPDVKQYDEQQVSINSILGF